MSFLLGARPVPTPPEPSRERLDMRLTPETRARVERQRARFEQSVSAYIRQAIMERLARDEASEPPPPKSPPKPPRPKP